MTQKLIIDGLLYSDPEEWRRIVAQNPYRALQLSTEILEGQSLAFNYALKAICDALQRVINGEITRLIINVPPGYGKTLSSVWAFVSKGFVVNQRSRFIHLSFSQELVLDNSSKIKEILLSEEFQHFNPLSLRNDTKAKGLWRTDQGGGVRAVQMGGTVTGFRAGQMGEGFSGALIIDDAIKPGDANSKGKLRTTNSRYNDTASSRLAHEKIPIILTMQRLSAGKPGADLLSCGDMSEFLLRGGSGEKWYHLMLPIIIDNSKSYPREWTHGIPIDHGIPDGLLWSYKHSKADAERLKTADKYVYAAQYDQRPKLRDGEKVFDVSCFGSYSQMPDLRKIIITSDTANKTKESHDYSVFLCSGLGTDGKIYVLDMLRGKWRSPDLIKKGSGFWEKHKRRNGMNRVGASEFWVEDAQSGTSLIQHLEDLLGEITVTGIPRTKDKFTRANGVLPDYSSGIVMLPSNAITDGEGNLVTNAKWVADYLDEHEDFTDNDTHDYDDIIDTSIDAVEILIYKNSSIYDDL